MTKNELSEQYSNACVRIREHVTAFYDEFMHDNDGDPITDTDKINKAILELRQAMNIELDLVREAAKEMLNI
jgi:hypothetical protein